MSDGNSRVGAGFRKLRQIEFDRFPYGVSSEELTQLLSALVPKANLHESCEDYFLNDVPRANIEPGYLEWLSWDNIWGWNDENSSCGNLRLANFLVIAVQDAVLYCLDLESGKVYKLLHGSLEDDKIAVPPENGSGDGSDLELASITRSSIAAASEQEWDTIADLVQWHLEKFNE